MEIEPNTILVRDDVSLRPAMLSDASDRYVGWLNNPQVTAFTEVVPGGHTLASVKDYIEQCRRAADAMLFAIEVAGHGHVGNLRISGISRTHRRATIALLIGETAVWNKGVGSRAIALASDYARDSLKVNKLCAGIYSVNQGSRAAFEKAGFACEATLHRHAFCGGAFVDIWQMAKFCDD